MAETRQACRTLEDWWNLGFDGFFDKTMRTPEAINAVTADATQTEFNAVVNGWLTAGDYSDGEHQERRED